MSMPKHASELWNLSLYLWDCHAIASGQDVLNLVEVVQDMGLSPAEGVWSASASPTPVNDLVPFLSKHHNDVVAIYESQGRPAPMKKGATRESWVFPVVRPDSPAVQANLSIGHRYPDIWSIGVFLSVWTYNHSGQNLSDFCTAWGRLLTELGQALYIRTQPTIGWIVGEPPHKPRDLVTAVDRNELVVGWRTWYSASQVGMFGEETLLSLPDSANKLAAGGIAHRLDAPAASVAMGDQRMYASVLNYLQHIGISPAWPRPVGPTGHRTVQRTPDEELNAFRRSVTDLLTFTAVLDGNQRLKVFAPDWSILSDSELGQAKRGLLLRMVREAAERELREHPTERIRFELGEGAPAELCRLMDQIATVNPRLSYIVLPNSN